MPKLISATCNKTKPAGARSVKKAFPETSRRKGYYVKNASPVVKLTRGKAKGCVRTARKSESKRIRQAHRGMLQRSGKKPSVKKSSKSVKKLGRKSGSSKA